MNKLISIFAGVLAAMSLAIAAETGLTTDAAERFAASIPGATDLAEKLKSEGVSDVFDDDMDIDPDKPFQPYSGTLAEVKANHPGAYKQIDSFAKKHGFKNAADWARAGDLTMLAYMASKMPPGMAAMSGAISPEMLSMMPKETADQYRKSMAVMNAVASVPAADREAVAPILSKIDMAVAESGQRAGAFDALEALPN